jgi:hypothetical protein
LGIGQLPNRVFRQVQGRARVVAARVIDVGRKRFCASCGGSVICGNATVGRPSIPPERLLRAQPLQIFYSIRSVRLLMERLDYNILLVRGLAIDDPIRSPTVFTKNRERLLNQDLAPDFLRRVVERAEFAGDVPAGAVSDRLVSRDQEQGFLLMNVALVAFGVWCFVWPIRRDWPTAAVFVWMWVTIEVINGVGQPLWSLRMGGYTPGVATAPVLLVIALYLARQLRTIARPSSGPRLIGDFIPRQFSPSPACERVWQAGQYEPRT